MLTNEDFLPTEGRLRMQLVSGYVCMYVCLRLSTCAVMHCTTLYCALQQGTVQHNNVLCTKAMYHALQHCVLQHSAIPCFLFLMHDAQN